MRPRSPSEEHRASTPLELLFDLVFVVAIAQAATGLHHELTEGHTTHALGSYAMVFFAIWWAWMNFTWFASAYDTDDIPYRLAVLLQITGALIFASGVTDAFGARDWHVATYGYVVMRLALVSLWLRASKTHGEHATTARRYAAGISAAQLGWLLLLVAPHEVAVPGFVLMALVELAVPAWAERTASTTWHPEHIVERYGLFTIIVLGESILSSSMAIQTATDVRGLTWPLASIIVGGLLTVFAMWWLYFDRPEEAIARSHTRAFVWGYAHYFVFGAAAAAGAGLAVAVDAVEGGGHIGDIAAGATVAVPVAVYLMVLWALHDGPAHRGPLMRYATPLIAAAILVTPFVGQAVLLTGILAASLLAMKLVARSHPRLAHLLAPPDRASDRA